MRHQMRAQYASTEEARKPGRAPGPVKAWHMVRGDEMMAMCGRVLTPTAEALPEEEWGRTAEPFCTTCGAVYLREVH
jgi:hypothetical protein